MGRINITELEMADPQLTINIDCFAEQLAWTLKAFNVMENRGRWEDFLTEIKDR